MTVTYKEYTEEKKAFFEKHGYDYSVSTSSLDEYDRYTKSYSFQDGAGWEELMTPTYEEVEVEVKKVMVKVEIKMLKTEYWSTETGSKYYYEKY